MDSEIKASFFKKVIIYFSIISGNITSYTLIYTIHQIFVYIQPLFISLNLLLISNPSNNKLLQEVASFINFANNPLATLAQGSSTILYLTIIYVIVTMLLTLALFIKTITDPIPEDHIPQNSFFGNFLSLHTEILTYWANNFFISFSGLTFLRPLLILVAVLNSLMSLVRIKFAYAQIECEELMYRKSSQHQVSIHLMKTIIPLTMLLDFGEILISNIACLALGITTFFHIIQKLPEKDDFVIKIQSLLIGMTCYVSVTGIFSYFFNLNSEVESIAGHVIFMAPVMGKMSVLLVDSKLNEIAYGAKKLDNPYYICHLSNLIKKMKRNMAWTNRQKYFSQSLLTSLSIQGAGFRLGSLNNNLDINTFSSQSKTILKEIFDINAKKFRNTGAFMSAYCKLVGLNFKMNLKANHLIKEINHYFKYDIPTLISMIVITSKIKSKKRDSALDTNVMIQIEKNFNSIKKLIDSFLVESTNFWERIDSIELNSIQIAESSKVLASLSIKIERAWLESRNIYIKNHYALPFLIYGVFVKNFKNDVRQSVDCIRKYHTLVIQDLIFNSVDQENQAIITVGAQNNNLGHVLSHSNSTFQLFGLKNAIIGQNVNKIMPDFFARRHDKFLKNHIENGKTTILNKKVRIYARDSQEFIFPIYLEVKVEFNQDQGIIFKGILTKITENKETIIVNEKGFIEEFTSKIQETLGLERQIYLPQLIDLKIKLNNSRTHLHDENGNHKKELLFRDILLKLAIPKEYPDTPPDSFTNYRLLNFKSNFKRKVHSDSEDPFHRYLLHQFYVSYFEYKFESESIFAIILEDVNSYHDFFEEDEESCDNLNIGEERPEAKVVRRVSNEVLKTFLRKRNLEELPSSLKQHGKTPDDPQKLAYNSSIGSRASISSNSLAKIEEIQRTLLTLPEDRLQSTLKGTVSFFLIFNICFAIIMFFFSEDILRKVLSALDSVNYSYQRMDSLVWVWRFAIGYQIRVRKISNPTPIDLARQRQVMMIYAPKLKAANEALLNNIWQSPRFIQEQAFAKTVRMNLTDSYGRMETMYYNTFDATNAYLDMIVRFNKTSDTITIVQNQTFVKYLLDNGQNDLLIETEKVIGLFRSEVARIFSEETRYLNTIFGINIALYILSIFIVVAILILFYVKTKKLFRALIMINSSVIYSMKEDIKHFKSALAINNMRKINTLGEKNILAKPKEFKFVKNNDDNAKGLNIKEKSILLKPYFKNKIPRFIILMLFNLITIILSTISFDIYSKAISIYFENNDYLTTASYNRYLYTFVIASNYYALADQYTGYIRNVPTITAIPQINLLISSNDLSLKVYTDSNGFKTPFLQEIFERNLCPYVLYFSFPGKDMNTECAILTKNYTYALVGVNLLVYEEARAISQILIANHSYANCKKLYSRFNNNVGPGTYVLGAAYEIIYNAMKENFDNLRPDLDANLLKNFLVQLIISSLLAVVFISLIYKYDNERIFGEALSVIPVAELINNNRVKSIAIEIFGKKLETLRGIKIKDIAKR